MKYNEPPLTLFWFCWKIKNFLTSSTKILKLFPLSDKKFFSFFCQFFGIGPRPDLNRGHMHPKHAYCQLYYRGLYIPPGGFDPPSSGLQPGILPLNYRGYFDKFLHNIIRLLRSRWGSNPGLEIRSLLFYQLYYGSIFR
jgi:hypothetical protein